MLTSVTYNPYNSYFHYMYKKTPIKIYKKNKTPIKIKKQTKLL